MEDGVQNGKGAFRVHSGAVWAPASLQEMMDEIFKDVLIHGGLAEEEHQRIVERVLKNLLNHGLGIQSRKI